MLKKFQKTLSIGLSGLLALGIGVANAADTAAKQLPNVLHEMVPHVVLPETIQYSKTAKNLPGTGYTGINHPHVATYVAYPSYQVPHTAEFKSVGQSVYPVSPKLLPLPPIMEQFDIESEDFDSFIEKETAWRDVDGKDVMLSNKNKVAEPIRLANGSEEVIPVLPMPNSVVTQTGIFCQHPAKPPAAWAFSSPIFKVASVPAGWGGQAGAINHNSPRGSGQHVGFAPGNSTESSEGDTMQHGVPYSTFQMGRQMPEQVGAQAQLLPNGMVLLTLPQDHSGCGLIRCRTNHAPRTLLLPPAGHGLPQSTPQSMMMPMQDSMMQAAMMPGGFGMSYMPVSQQQMIPQMQTVPVMAMTPTGPTLVGYQQIPMANPMAMTNPIMNPMMNQQFPQTQQMQMAVALPNPLVASQMAEAAGAVAAEINNETLQPPALIGSAGAVQAMANPMAMMVATPFGYALQVPANTVTAQTDTTAQLTQMQQTFIPSQIQMPANPYAGLYATPFGYIAMNQSAGQLGSFGQPMMMNVGYQPGIFSGGQGGMNISDMLQIMAFINSNKPQRRAKMAERIAERREARREACANDPIAQLMQAWTTPYVAPDTTLRMPSRNAYPYGYFGVQTLPANTANYGGYHNLYMGNTAYPGLY